MSKIERDPNAQPIAKNVGYYIPADVREKEITTPGGGGDSVSYKPYKDIETAYYKMLSNVFKNTVVLKAPNDVEAIQKNELSYVFVPAIVTNSSSPSPFTWPPTKFSVQLGGDVLDPSGAIVFSQTVTGEGQAEFAEFKADFSLWGKRAAQDALLKMQKLLLNTPELKN